MVYLRTYHKNGIFRINLNWYGIEFWVAGERRQTKGKILENKLASEEAGILWEDVSCSLALVGPSWELSPYLGRSELIDQAVW